MEIYTSCETLKNYSSSPVKFKLSLRNQELVLGDELYIDQILPDGKELLHIVDSETRFSAATFLDSHGNNYIQSVEAIWLGFIETS